MKILRSAVEFKAPASWAGKGVGASYKLPLIYEMLLFSAIGVKPEIFDGIVA